VGLSLQDEIVLVTTDRPDGTCARIVFRNIGFDDAATLEKLCEKVHAAGGSRQGCSSRAEGGSYWMGAPLRRCIKQEARATCDGVASWTDAHPSAHAAHQQRLVQSAWLLACTVRVVHCCPS
jgi:hypothetical protein